MKCETQKCTTNETTGSDMAEEQVKTERTRLKEGSRLPFLGYRHFYALMGFLVLFTINAQRISMGISIVAMVNHTAVHDPVQRTFSSTSCPSNYSSTPEDRIPKLTGSFQWGSQLQGYILGAGFLGFVVMQAPAGKLTERYGANIIIIYASILAAFSTVLTPFASWWHAYVVVAAQFVRGMAQGALLPPIYVMMGNWFPAAERGFLSTVVITGYPAGAFVGGLLSGLICDIPYLGWPVTFYVFGGLSILLSMIFFLSFYETPHKHPKISHEELKHITGFLEQKEGLNNRLKVPWGQIFRSVPVYALIVGLFGHYWIISYFLTVHPTYLGTVLHFNMTEDGLISSLPFILKLLGGWISSFISDWLGSHNYVGVDKLRKGCNFLGFFSFSLCVLAVYFARCNATLNIIFFALSSLSVGISLPGCMIVCMDMTPRFAGPLMGVVSALSSIGNVAVPIITGYVTKNERMEEWHWMFLISVVVVMASSIVFAVFGSAKVQPWNSPEEQDFPTSKENGGGMQMEMSDIKSYCSISKDTVMETKDVVSENDNKLNGRF